MYAYNCKGAYTVWQINKYVLYAPFFNNQLRGLAHGCTLLYVHVYTVQTCEGAVSGDNDAGIGWVHTKKLQCVREIFRVNITFELQLNLENVKLSPLFNTVHIFSQ